MGNVYLTSGAADEDERENLIYEGIYLWAFLRGEKIDQNSEKVKMTRRATFRETPGLNRGESEEPVATAANGETQTR